MGIPLWLLRVECRLETLVTLDDTIDVGFVHGGHADGERHGISDLHFKSLFKKKFVIEYRVASDFRGYFFLKILKILNNYLLYVKI